MSNTEFRSACDILDEQNAQVSIAPALDVPAQIIFDWSNVSFIARRSYSYDDVFDKFIHNYFCGGYSGIDFVGVSPTRPERIYRAKVVDFFRSTIQKVGARSIPAQFFILRVSDPDQDPEITQFFVRQSTISAYKRLAK